MVLRDIPIRKSEYLKQVGPWSHEYEVERLMSERPPPPPRIWSMKYQSEARQNSLGVSLHKRPQLRFSISIQKFRHPVTERDKLNYLHVCFLPHCTLNRVPWPKAAIKPSYKHTERCYSSGLRCSTYKLLFVCLSCLRRHAYTQYANGQERDHVLRFFFRQNHVLRRSTTLLVALKQVSHKSEPNSKKLSCSIIKKEKEELMSEILEAKLKILQKPEEQAEICRDWLLHYLRKQKLILIKSVRLVKANEGLTLG
jgi:hypothetical protein